MIGHQGAVNGCYYSRNTGTVFTYGGDGRVLEWTSGEAHVIAVSIILINHSSRHKGNCNGAVEVDGMCVSIGW